MKKSGAFTFAKFSSLWRYSPMAGWSYPDISQEDLLRMTKGFLDMLVLASGYQSSGRLAHWDSLNVKKAFHWALFLENVFRSLRCSEDHQGSLAEVYDALSQITSSPSFPKGLSHKSSVTLCQARTTMLEHLVHTLPLRDAHLRAFVTAIIELESEELQSKQGFSRSPKETSHSTNYDTKLDDGYIQSAMKELGQRQAAVSYISVAEAGLAVLSKTIRKTNCYELGIAEVEHLQLAEVVIEERPIELVVWNHWRSRSLSYILDNRTVRLISGAKLLFSSPKSQWADVIERLSISADSDGLSEIMELLLLGSSGWRWSYVIQKFMASSYESLTISKMYQEIQSLPLRRSPSQFFKEDANFEGSDVLDQLEGFLRNQFDKLWKLLPVVAAIAIPPRSQLFRLYMTELDGQISGSSSIRCCSCITEGKQHRHCEVAERIWCLYVFHVQGSC